MTTFRPQVEHFVSDLFTHLGDLDADHAHVSWAAVFVKVQLSAKSTCLDCDCTACTRMSGWIRELGPGDLCAERLCQSLWGVRFAVPQFQSFLGVGTWRSPLFLTQKIGFCHSLLSRFGLVLNTSEIWVHVLACQTGMKACSSPVSQQTCILRDESNKRHAVSAKAAAHAAEHWEVQKQLSG